MCSICDFEVIPMLPTNLDNGGCEITYTILGLSVGSQSMFLITGVIVSLQNDNECSSTDVFRFYFAVSSGEEAGQLTKPNDSVPYRQPCTPHKLKPPTNMLTSTSDDDDSDTEIPKRPTLSAPQLSAVGSEIIV